MLRIPMEKGKKLLRDQFNLPWGGPAWQSLCAAAEIKKQDKAALSWVRRAFTSILAKWTESHLHGSRGREAGAVLPLELPLSQLLIVHLPSAVSCLWKDKFDFMVLFRSCDLLVEIKEKLVHYVLKCSLCVPRCVWGNTHLMMEKIISFFSLTLNIVVYDQLLPC